MYHLSLCVTNTFLINKKPNPTNAIKGNKLNQRPLSQNDLSVTNKSNTLSNNLLVVKIKTKESRLAILKYLVKDRNTTKGIKNNR